MSPQRTSCGSLPNSLVPVLHLRTSCSTRTVFNGTFRAEDFLAEDSLAEDSLPDDVFSHPRRSGHWPAKCVTEDMQCASYGNARFSLQYHRQRSRRVGGLC